MLDTSVIVAALLQFHDSHSRALPWLNKAESGEIEGMVSSHSLSEVYKILTGMNRRPRFTTHQVIEIIQSRIIPFFEVISLSEIEHIAALERLAHLNIRGGTIYDGIIAHAAVKGGAEQIVTFNESDFRRVSAGLSLQIIVRSLIPSHTTTGAITCPQKSTS